METYAENLKSYVDQLPCTNIKYLYFSEINGKLLKVNDNLKFFMIKNKKYFIINNNCKHYSIYPESAIDTFNKIEVSVKDKNAIVYTANDDDNNEMNYGGHIDFNISSQEVFTSTFEYGHANNYYFYKNENTCTFIFKPEMLDNFGDIKCTFPENRTVSQRYYKKEDYNMIKHLCEIILNNYEAKEEDNKSIFTDNLIEFIYDKFYKAVEIAERDIISLRVFQEDDKNIIMIYNIFDSMGKIVIINNKNLQEILESKNNNKYYIKSLKDIIGNIIDYEYDVKVSNP